MGRPILAVVAGFVTWTVIWLGSNAAIKSAMPDAYLEDGATSDTPILVGTLGVAILACLVSGYLTATILKRRSITVAAILGVVLLGVGVMVQAQYWNVMPMWYHLGFLFALLPFTVLGGLLRKRNAKRGTHHIHYDKFTMDESAIE